MRRTMIILAAACLVAPAQVTAQTNDIAEIEIDETPDGGDDGSSRWGLLGLLGLAGLLGLKRREPDIHVDARRDKVE